MELQENQPLCVTQVGSTELNLSSETHNCVLRPDFLLPWSPHTAPDLNQLHLLVTCWKDLLPNATRSCSTDTAVAGFCNQMDQQESVQFWPGSLLLCASICKAKSLSENWDGCNKFPSSSYLLCNKDGLISDSVAIWLHSPDAELNADSVELILHTLAGNCNMSVSVKILFLKSSLSNDPALIKKLREFST